MSQSIPSLNRTTLHHTTTIPSSNKRKERENETNKAALAALNSPGTLLKKPRLEPIDEKNRIAKEAEKQLIEALLDKNEEEAKRLFKTYAKLIDVDAPIHSEKVIKGATILWLAVYLEQWRVAEVMLEQKPKANFNAAPHGEDEDGVHNGKTILWLAAFHQKSWLVNKILMFVPEADINAAPDGDPGRTVFWMVASSEDWEITQSMLMHNRRPNFDARPKSKNDDAITALHHIIQGKNWKLASLAIQNHTFKDFSFLDELCRESASDPFFQKIISLLVARDALSCQGIGIPLHELDPKSQEKIAAEREKLRREWDSLLGHFADEWHLGSLSMGAYEHFCYRYVCSQLLFNAPPHADLDLFLRQAVSHLYQNRKGEAIRCCALLSFTRFRDNHGFSFQIDLSPGQKQEILTMIESALWKEVCDDQLLKSPLRERLIETLAAPSSQMRWDASLIGERIRTFIAELNLPDPKPINWESCLLKKAAMASASSRKRKSVMSKEEADLKKIIGPIQKKPRPERIRTSEVIFSSGEVKGEHPLIQALLLKEWGKAKELLETQIGIDINVRVLTVGKFKGASALWLAGYFQEWGLVQLILSRYDSVVHIDSNPEEGDLRGFTLLLNAAGSHNWPLVRFMLQSYPNINIEAARQQGPSKGLTTLLMAASDNRWDIVHLILELHPRVNVGTALESEKQEITPLWLAANAQEWGLVKKMLSMNPQASIKEVPREGPYKGQSLLWLAAGYGKWDLVHALYHQHPDANIDAAPESKLHAGKSLLWLAVEKQEWDLVETMLKLNPKANINAAPGEGLHQGRSVLLMAAAYQQWDLVRLMLELSPEANINAAAGVGQQKGKTALWYAAKACNWDMVFYILNKYPMADLDAEAKRGSEQGMTPLWLAASQLQWDVVLQMLRLKPQANVNASPTQGNLRGTTLLTLAAEDEEWEVVRFVLENNPSVNINAAGLNEDADKSRGVISYAIEYGEWELAWSLIQRYELKNLGFVTELWNRREEDSQSKKTLLLVVAKDAMTEGGIGLESLTAPSEITEWIAAEKKRIQNELAYLIESYADSWHYSDEGIEARSFFCYHYVRSNFLFGAPAHKGLNSYLKKVMDLLYQKRRKEAVRNIAALIFSNFRNHNEVPALTRSQKLDILGMIERTLWDSVSDDRLLRTPYRQNLAELIGTGDNKEGILTRPFIVEQVAALEQQIAL